MLYFIVDKSKILVDPTGTQTDTCIMKTKPTLFVTVLAAALFGMGCASVKVTEEQLQEGLIAHYPFNGDANDVSGKKNHATAKETALSLDRNEAKDQAFQFNGASSYIEIKKTRVMSFNADDFAVAVWLKFGRQNNPRRAGIIIGDANRIEGHHGGVVVMVHDRPKGAKTLYPNKTNKRSIMLRLTSRNNEILELPDSPHLFDDSWRHYIFQKSGNTLSIHINGKKAASREVKLLASHRGSKTNIFIGTNISLGGQYYRGSMDEFRIYNRALSSDEVKALYDLEKPKK